VITRTPTVTLIVTDDDSDRHPQNGDRSGAAKYTEKDARLESKKNSPSSDSLSKEGDGQNSKGDGRVTMGVTVRTTVYQEGDDGDGQTLTSSRTRENEGKLALGMKIIATTPSGKEYPGFVTHPRNDEGKWGCKVYTGGGSWIEDIFFPPESLQPEIIPSQPEGVTLHPGDKVLYVPYGCEDYPPKEMIYVGKGKGDRHWIVRADRYTPGMKGSRQWCNQPRLADGKLREDIFWGSKSSGVIFP